MQCKDVPDRPILELLAKNSGKWHNWYFGDEFDVSRAMPPGTPEKVRLGKMRMMIRRGVVDGCDCGCRGDFVITEKGKAELEKQKYNVMADAHGWIKVDDHYPAFGLIVWVSAGGGTCLLARWQRKERTF